MTEVRADTSSANNVGLCLTTAGSLGVLELVELIILLAFQLLKKLLIVRTLTLLSRQIWFVHSLLLESTGYRSSAVL